MVVGIKWYKVMNREDYLLEHHHICESMIGLISIQDDIEGVRKVLDVWKPKLKDIQKQRYVTLCAGMSDKEIQEVLEFTGVN